MTLTTNFVHTQYNSAIENFIRSLVQKTFSNHRDISDVVVNLYAQNDPVVPWKCHIHVTQSGGELSSSESVAANYLTAFSQALNRVKRQFEKRA